jgi:glycosyltransferase involved in cell wall biosynthesis
MVENRGRDVLPFLQVLNLIGTQNYTYLCKLHTKKSVEIDNGDAWRKLLYYDLIGSAEIVNENIQRFKNNNKLGIITGKNLILNGAHFDLGNQIQLQNLASVCHIPFTNDYHFAAGTMFWIRVDLLIPLLSLTENSQLLFEKESGQTDHTLAHALERFFGLLCTNAHLEIAESHADYTNLDKKTLEQLAMLAFTQRFKNDREIQYRDKLIKERDYEIQKRDQEILNILSSKSYKLTFPFRKLPFITQTILHFNIKKINMQDSNEFRFVQAIKRRLPKNLISLLKRIRRKVKKHTQKNKLWHQPLTSISKYKGNTVLIIAELSIPQCTKYRVEQKVEMLKTLGYNTWVISWTDFHEARHLLQMSALVFFYRVPAYPLVVDLIKESNRLGITSFFDVDDLIFDKELLAQNINLKKLPKKSQKELLKGADLYQEALSLTTNSTASTKILGEAMTSYNKGENYLLPNCLDQELLTHIDHARNSLSSHEGLIKIVYGSGTSTHDIDFEEVADALVHILNTYKNVVFIIHGTLTLPSKFDALTSQITHIPFMPTKEYYAHLQGYDINLAPLEKTLFNDAKSNIKYLEASIFKLPTIASNVSEYNAVIKHEENGFLATNTKSWIFSLEKLIQSKVLRKNIGISAYNTVLDNYQIKNIAQKYMLPLIKEHMYHKDQDTKHILMANVLYNPISFGGATIVIEELSQRINKKEGYEVTVFTGFFDENYDLPRPYDIVRYEVNDVPVILVRFPFPMSKELEYHNDEIEKVFDKILSSLNPDLVHFHSIQQLSASIAKPCLNYQIPYIITLHDMWWLCEKQFMLKPDNTYCYQTKIDTDYCITQCTHNADRTKNRTTYLKPILNNAALLLTPSSFQAQMYLYNSVDPKKIKVNKNAIIFPSSNYKKKPSEKIRFAYLGGKATHKGYDFLKEIFESINTENYELIVVDLHRKLGHNSIIASDWDIKGTLTLSDGYEYSQRALDDFFSNIDVLLFPSQWKESFGLTIREALVRDVWVISTDAGGVVEDIREEENGNIVSIGDHHGFKMQIESSIANTHKLQNYHNPHKDTIRAYDAQVDELLDYYNDIWDIQ